MTDQTQKPKPRAAKAPPAPAMPSLSTAPVVDVVLEEPVVTPTHPALDPVEVVLQDTPPAPEPVKSSTKVVEQGTVQTKHGFPLYVPTQHKTLAPRTPTPLVLDAWVKNQIAVGGLELIDG